MEAAIAECEHGGAHYQLPALCITAFGLEGC